MVRSEIAWLLEINSQVQDYEIVHFDLVSYLRKIHYRLPRSFLQLQCNKKSPKRNCEKINYLLQLLDLERFFSNLLNHKVISIF